MPRGGQGAVRWGEALVVGALSKLSVRLWCLEAEQAEMVLHVRAMPVRGPLQA